MKSKFRHEEPNYAVEGILEGETIKIHLITANKKFEKTYTYGELNDEIKKACDSVEEFFEVMEDSRNIIVEPLKGAIILIVKAVKINKVVEIPSEIHLVEIKKDGEIPDELK